MSMHNRTEKKWKEHAFKPIVPILLLQMTFFLERSIVSIMRNRIIPSIILAVLFSGLSCAAAEESFSDKLKSKLSGITERVKEGDYSDSQEKKSDSKEAEENKKSDKKNTDSSRKDGTSGPNEKKLKEKLSNFLDGAKERIVE